MPDLNAYAKNKSFEGSDLLAELAGVATEKVQSLQTEEQQRQERSRNLNDTLNKIFQYFSLFTSHLGKIKPATPRTYQVDPQAVYSNIQWVEAHADLRKQSLSDDALVDHVSLKVKLSAPHSVSINRRWNELDKVQKELIDFGLRPVEDLNTQVRRQPQKEFVEIELAPDFLLRMQFQGNYETGNIELLSNNFDGFGLASYLLNPPDVNQPLLDEIGRFLLGRNFTLPEILASSRFTPKYPVYR